MKMDYIKIAPNSEIQLEVKDGCPIDLAIAEALAMVKDNNLAGADLFTGNGFMFLIDADSNVDEQVEEYKDWLGMREQME